MTQAMWAKRSFMNSRLAFFMLLVSTTLFIAFLAITDSYLAGGPGAGLTDPLVNVCGGDQSLRPLHPLSKLPPIVCTSESCKSACSTGDSPSMPRIIHLLWKNGSVPRRFAEPIRSWYNLHPNWTFVLWRDSDMNRLVLKCFPGLQERFNSLPQHIMRVDMFRYMLLYQYGGLYADMDYTAVASVDSFRQFPAVVTREPEFHSILPLGLTWPLRPMASPALMMSVPGHRFFHFVLHKLARKVLYPWNSALDFAGPLGLTGIIEDYHRLHRVASACEQYVYMPPSYSFYPFPQNRLKEAAEMSPQVKEIVSNVAAACKSIFNKLAVHRSANLTAFCSDLDSLEAITDGSHRVYAKHDIVKQQSSYAMTKEYAEAFLKRQIDARDIVPGLVYGEQFMQMSH